MGDEGEWDPGDRHQRDGHSDVHQDLEHEHRNDPAREQHAEGIAGAEGDAQRREE